MPQQRTLLLPLALGAVCAPSLTAQLSTPVPLNYNFNGIVHAGESNNPDALNGYRSISDRGLDFSGGVPNDSLLNGYTIVSTPNTLDIVHLGNRNTVNGGGQAFGATPDGDPFGVQPTWLTNVDQTGPQTTNLSANPILLPIEASLKVIFQVSNGGGAFDVTVGFLDGSSTTATVSGPDWFGGAYAGTDNTDLGLPGNSLSIEERSVDLSAHVGKVIGSVTFENAQNTNGGYAILAARVDLEPPLPVVRVPLNYNFNGIVHAGEAGLPDDLNGFRSISDRALDFSAGVPSDALLSAYDIVDQPGMLDMVHLGNRNLVDGGSKFFDPTPDGNDVGVQPSWLTNVDQSTPQTTTLTNPVMLEQTSSISFLLQISNGGGSFDVRLGFLDGTSTVASVNGPDWFGGAYAGTQNIDSGAPGANLSISERSIQLGGFATKLLSTITFENRSNLNAGYAILAANVTGCDTPGQVNNLGGGNGSTLSTTSTGAIGGQLVFSLSGGAASAPGVLLLGFQRGTTPLGSVLPGCTGTLIAFPASIDIPGATNANGAYSLNTPGVPDPNYCGNAAYFQHAGLDLAGSCQVRLSNAIEMILGY